MRELRAESRRAANYWLRVVAAGALILVFASIMLGVQASLAALMCFLLHRKVCQREFAVGKGNRHLLV